MAEKILTKVVRFFLSFFLNFPSKQIADELGDVTEQVTPTGCPV